jgi:predicted nucleotidyltransferase
MTTSALLAELRERLERAYGERLSTVVHFGSEARGQASPESDIDLLVVLKRLIVDFGEELERSLIAVYPVSLRLGRRISVKVLAQDEYDRGDSPLLREIRRFGVAA